MIKMYVTDVTSHQWFSIPTTLQNAYKVHKHKTLSSIKLSHVKCASEEKR